MNIKTTLKTSVAAAALFAIAAPVATPASADIASGNKNKLVVSGQVVRALYYADDGFNEQLFNSTGATANTRVRWVASGTLNENVTAGATIEFDVQTSNTADANFTDSGDGEVYEDKTSWSIRLQYAWVKHKQFGQLSLGRTDAAANGNDEFTLAGIGGVSTPNTLWQGGNIQFLETGTTATGSFTGVAPGDVLTNLDFSSRDDVIRYDTPTFMGLSLAVSLNEGGRGEVGARYSRKFGPINMIVGAGYSKFSPVSTEFDDEIGGSIAVLHDSGLNASFAAGERSRKTGQVEGVGAHFWGASGGYKAKIFKVGGTNFRIQYNQSTHVDARGDQGTGWGIDAMQNFDAIGATVSLGYRNYDYENKRAGHCATGECSIDSVDVIGLQAAFQF